MARLPEGQISKHGIHGYRVTVGRKADGKPRLFWLGKHEEPARYAAHCYRTAWAQMQAVGIQHWMPDLERKAKETISAGQRTMRQVFNDHSRRAQMIGPLVGLAHPDTAALAVPGPALSLATTPTAATPAAPAKSKHLYEAVEAYLAAMKGKRLSDAHKWRAEQVLDVTLKRAVADCPMESIDFVWLDRLADHFKSRPKSRKGKKRDRKPISPQTVKTTLSYIRHFFSWCDDVGFGGWEGPRKLSKPFRVRLDDLRTSAELRQVNFIQQFDLNTLVKIYRIANSYQRAIMLTALFTAGTQKELAVLEKSEFDLSAGMLHHWRNKTKIEGRFWLPAELIVLLKGEFKKHRRQPLAFYTGQGLPLVTYREGKLVSDSIRQMWLDLRVKAEVPKALPFKYIRKFVADWMVRHGGETMGQVALSHARQTVLAKNYTSAQDFAAFNDLQRKLHGEFIAAGMFEEQDGKAREDCEGRRRPAGTVTSMSRRRHSGH